MRKCGPGFYGDPETGECEPCHRACETCTGFGHQQCRTCREGLQLRQGTCVGPARTPVEGEFWNGMCLPREKAGAWPPSLPPSLFNPRLRDVPEMQAGQGTKAGSGRLVWALPAGSDAPRVGRGEEAVVGGHLSWRETQRAAHGWRGHRVSIPAEGTSELVRESCRAIAQRPLSPRFQSGFCHVRVSPCHGKGQRPVRVGVFGWTRKNLSQVPELKLGQLILPAA